MRRKNHNKEEQLNAVIIAINNFSIFHSYNCGGLCHYVEELYNRNLLTFTQLNELRYVMSKYIVSKRDPLHFFFNKDRVAPKTSGYWWPAGDTEQRLRYLQYLKTKIS